jgi:beta-lactamase class A
MQASVRHDTFSSKTKHRHNLRRWIICLLLLFVVSLCGVFIIINANNRTSSKGLQSVIDGWIATHGTGYSVAVLSLDGDSVAASYKATTTTVPASTYKLFVTYAAYHLAEQGKLSLSSPLLNGLTAEQCIENAIVNSDNTCAEVIGNQIGWETIDQIDAKAGFTDTVIDNYDADGGYTGDKQSTAANLAAYLEQLQKGTLLNSTDTKALLGYMERQVYQTGIPAGSAGAAVADKVGFLETVTHDAAIVYAPKGTYVLVIMSTTGNNWANIKDLAAAIYQYLNQV